MRLDVSAGDILLFGAASAGNTAGASFDYAANTIAIFKAGGTVGLGTASPAISDGTGLHIGGKILRLGTSKTPASAGAAGNAGEICWDASYIYVCTATNAWKRAFIDTW
jgi:hypothetical protein